MHLKICDGVEDCVESLREKNSKINWDNVSVDEKYCPYRFMCTNSRPKDKNLVTISKYKVCDDHIDCEMAEDEAEGKINLLLQTADNY